MNKWNELYKLYQQEEDAKKRQNFDIFMDTVNSGLTKDLNNAWDLGDTNKYDQLLSNVKAQGIRVFRNSQGKHKLKFV